MSNTVYELQSIADTVRGCTNCNLCLTRTYAVPAEGPYNPKLVIVGEAPGFDEDKTGRPFVGDAGKFLDELLELAGLNRSEVYITNVVKCRPPNNKRPSDTEINTCRVYLNREIEILKPKLIVILGRTALQVFFPKAKLIGKFRGTFISDNKWNYYVSYHPAAALHRVALETVIEDDFRKLGRYMRGETLDFTPS